MQTNVNILEKLKQYCLYWPNLNIPYYQQTADKRILLFFLYLAHFIQLWRWLGHGRTSLININNFLSVWTHLSVVGIVANDDDWALWGALCLWLISKRKTMILILKEGWIWAVFDEVLSWSWGLYQIRDFVWDGMFARL